MNQAVPVALDRSRAMVAPALRSAVDRLTPRLRKAVQYHFGWVDENGEPVDGDGGKNIRAALALLSASAVGADERCAVPGAVAIELVHNFSLIHDDVIDVDRERRHRPTVWVTFGVGPAIVVGDALATLAVDILLEQPGQGGARAVRALQEATSAMIVGQADDIAFEYESNVSLDECLAMARAKTGAILACASSLGAILAGAPQPKVSALADFGMHLGLAFQAVDDVLGIWGEPQVTGKPVWSDLRQRKKTIPIVAALAQYERGDYLRDAIDAAANSNEDAHKAANLLEECGGRALTEQLAASELQHALDALARARPERPAANELEAIAHFIVGRDR